MRPPHPLRLQVVGDLFFRPVTPGRFICCAMRLSQRGGSPRAAGTAGERSIVAVSTQRDITPARSLQLAGLLFEDMPAVCWTPWSGLGLTSRPIGHDNPRNITGQPSGRDRPREIVDTRPLVQAIQGSPLFLRDGPASTCPASSTWPSAVAPRTAFLLQQHGPRAFLPAHHDGPAQASP